MNWCIPAAFVLTCTAFAQNSIREQALFTQAPNKIAKEWASIPLSNRGVLTVRLTNQEQHFHGTSQLQLNRYNADGIAIGTESIPLHELSDIDNLFLFGKDGSVVAGSENGRPFLLRISASGELIQKTVLAEETGLISSVKLLGSKMGVCISGNVIVIDGEKQICLDEEYASGLGSNGAGELLVLSNRRTPNEYQIYENAINGSIDTVYASNIVASHYNATLVRTWSQELALPLNDNAFDAVGTRDGGWALACVTGITGPAAYDRRGKLSMISLKSNGDFQAVRQYGSEMQISLPTPYVKKVIDVSITALDDTTLVLNSELGTYEYRGRSSYENRFYMIGTSGDVFHENTLEGSNSPVLVSGPDSPIFQWGMNSYAFLGTGLTLVDYIAVHGKNYPVIPRIYRESTYYLDFAFSDAAQRGDELIAIGSTNRFGGGNSDLLVSRFALDGTLLEHRTIGDQRSEQGTAMVVHGDTMSIAGTIDSMLHLWNFTGKAAEPTGVSLNSSGTAIDLVSQEQGLCLLAQHDTSVALYAVDHKGSLIPLYRKNGVAKTVTPLVSCATGWVFATTLADSSYLIRISADGNVMHEHSAPADSVSYETIAYRQGVISVSHRTGTNSSVVHRTLFTDSLAVIQTEPESFDIDFRAHHLMADGTLLVAGEESGLRGYNSAGEMFWSGGKTHSYIYGSTRQIIPINEARTVVVGQTTPLFGGHRPYIGAQEPYLAILEWDPVVRIAPVAGPKTVRTQVIGRTLCVEGVGSAATVAIYSLQGRKVLESPVGEMGRVALDGIAAGTYVMRLVHGTVSQVQRIALY